MDQLPVIKPEWLVGITITQTQKDLWISSMRGGAYRQTTGAMQRRDSAGKSFCCLGLLCFLMPDKPGTADSLLGEWNDYLETWEPDKPLTHGSIQRVLAAMNDNGKSFAEIAEFIEANIPACDEVKS